MSSASSVTDAQIDRFAQLYKERRKVQMFRFFGATAFTLLSARLAFRGVASRKYIPTMFQLNHKPPSFSYKGEVVHALGYGTALSTGGFAMLGFGLCWIWDVSTVKELGAKLKNLMGDDSHDKIIATNMELDEDTQKVADALEAMLTSKK